jgi:serine/threonine protein kinase
MIGFKSNQIKTVPENSLPETTRWLILTNNSITKLPKSIGRCSKLQKVALAGNFLTSLPSEMANCKNLELLRISANRLSTFPEWLLGLPKLSWLAFAGNPFSSQQTKTQNELQELSWNKFEILEQLGEGASGNIYKALWTEMNKEVAIKVYKGEVTSDGFPDDEMRAAISAGTHPGLVNLLGTIIHHPQQKQGLVMDLIPSSFYNLGLPPSLETCSRDTFPNETFFSSAEVLKIATTVTSLADQLHQQGLMHGDLYAHNILIDKEVNTLMGDFGAATFYDTQDDIQKRVQYIEARAFGCLLDDLLSLPDPNEKNTELTKALLELRTNLMQEKIRDRPLFSESLALLTKLSSVFRV